LYLEKLAERGGGSEKKKNSYGKELFHGRKNGKQFSDLEKKKVGVERQGPREKKKVSIGRGEEKKKKRWVYPEKKRGGAVFRQKRG